MGRHKGVPYGPVRRELVRATLVVARTDSPQPHGTKTGRRKGTPYAVLRRKLLVRSHRRHPHDLATRIVFEEQEEDSRFASPTGTVDWTPVVAHWATLHYGGCTGSWIRA